MQVLDRTGVGTLWSICKTKFALKDHSHNYLPLSGGILTGDLLFSDSGTTFRQIKGTCGGNDFWRIGGGATKQNDGYMEIATADDGTEPIYIRQYIGVFATAKRTATILDSEGNTSFPGTVAAAKFKGALEGNASTASNASTVNGHTVNANVPSNAKFTDTNTWRPIQDNLTSTSTSESLSANQGRVLKGLVDGKANSSHTHSWSQISGAPATATRWPSWGEVTGKPGSFTPSSHTHDWSQVTGKPDLEYIVPTLSNIPTSSTLTFVENGVTKHFKIGYMCRVVDSSAKYGYKFYQLYNISGNNAVWGEVVGGGGDYDEKVIVTLKSSASASDSKLNGVIITVKNKTTNQVQTQTWNGTSLVFKIPATNRYTVSASNLQHYLIPASQSYSAGVGTTKNVVITYTYIPIGVYIFDTEGKFTTTDKWNTSNNNKVVGVSVRTENSEFVMAPTYNTVRIMWSSNEALVNGIVTSSDKSIASKDYAGESNTDKIIEQIGTGDAPAAEYCRNYTFKNGKKGYLWALGEAIDASNNRSAINAAMDKIGGSGFKEYQYWTSTQYSYDAAFMVDNYNNASGSGFGKESLSYVHAVCSFY